MSSALLWSWWPGPDQQWRRNQYVAVGALFVAFVGFSFAMPFLPLFLLQLDIKTTEEAALWSGVVFGVSPLISAILAPFWGSVSDRFSKKLLVLRCLLAFTVLLVLMAFVTHMWQMLALRIVLGFFGGFTTLATIMVMSYAPAERTAEAVGMVQAAQILGQGIGPVFGGVTADLVGLRPSFVAAALACAVAAVVLMLFLKEEPVAVARGRKRGGDLSWRQLLLLSNVAVLMVVLFGSRFVERTFDPVMPLFVSQLDVDAGWVATGVGLIIGLSTVGRTLSSTMIGTWARQRSPRWILLLCLGASAASCIPMAVANAYWQMLILRGIEGFLSGGLITLAISTGAERIPRAQRGTGVGILMSGGMYGSATAPVIAGIIGAVNLRAVFLVDAVIFTALTVATLLFMREVPAEAPDRPAIGPSIAGSARAEPAMEEEA